MSEKEDWWITPSEHTWAKGLSFEDELQRIAERISKSNTTKKRAYYSILLTQLVNGCRISEACEAVFRWAETGKPKVRVRVRKRSDEYLRLVVIPDAVLEEGRTVKRFLKRSFFNAHFINNMVHFTKYHLYNTHALRYAFITKMSNEVSAQLIAKMTGHASLKHILHYTERVKAEQKLEDSVLEANTHLSLPKRIFREDKIGEIVS